MSVIRDVVFADPIFRKWNGQGWPRWCRWSYLPRINVWPMPVTSKMYEFEENLSGGFWRPRRKQSKSWKVGGKIRVKIRKEEVRPSWVSIVESLSKIRPLIVWFFILYPFYSNCGRYDYIETHSFCSNHRARVYES